MHMKWNAKERVIQWKITYILELINVNSVSDFLSIHGTVVISFKVSWYDSIG